MNIQIFLWVSNGGEPNSNSTTGKTNTLYLKMLPKKASKILQKCNFYFKMLPKRFEIDSKCNSISRNASKKASKMWLHLQYASNKGQTITIKCFYSSLTKQSPIWFKMQFDSWNASKMLQKGGSTSNMLQIKGKQ